MKKIFLCLLILTCTSFLYPDKLVELPKIEKPVSIAIEGNKIYIIEETRRVSVYSLINHELLREIGRRGEGPGEFKRTPLLKILPDFLFFCTFEKVMKFSKDGKLLEEKRLFPLGRALPIRNNYVRIGFKSESGKNYNTVNLLDNDLNRTKELYTQERINRRGVLIPIRDYLGIDSFGGKCFVAEGRKGFFIEVFNSDGKKLDEIEKNIGKIRISNEYKEKLIYQRVNDPRGGAEWKEAVRRFKVEYPKYFPDMRELVVAGDRIHVQTYRQEKDDAEFIILDLEGNILNRVLLPLFQEGSLIDRYPYTFSKDSYYYLKDNPERQVWELHRIQLPEKKGLLFVHD